MGKGQRANNLPINKMELAGLDEFEESLDVVRLILISAAL